jgi:ankyrin repeat domain-containing protein 17
VNVSIKGSVEASEGISETSKALINAAYDGEMLIDSNAGIDLKTDNNDTALIAASSKGYLEIVSLLLAQKAVVDTVDDDGNTALLLAAWGGYLDVVKALVKEGANFTKRNHDGNNARQLANLRGHEAIERFLETLDIPKTK